MPSPAPHPEGHRASIMPRKPTQHITAPLASHAGNVRQSQQVAENAEMGMPG